MAACFLNKPTRQETGIWVDSFTGHCNADFMQNRSGRRAKRRRDVKRLAKSIAKVGIGETPTRDDVPPVDQGNGVPVVASGRLGERKGGKARAKKLGKKKLSAIVKKVEYAHRKLRKT